MIIFWLLSGANDVNDMFFVQLSHNIKACYVCTYSRQAQFLVFLITQKQIKSHKWKNRIEISAYEPKLPKRELETIIRADLLNWAFEKWSWLLEEAWAGYHSSRSTYFLDWPRDLHTCWETFGKLLLQKPKTMGGLYPKSLIRNRSLLFSQVIILAFNQKK